jgi:enoyl-CoA hydratase/carnithine racemase
VSFVGGATSEVILCTQDGPVGIITLNRPEAMNTISEDLERELHAALDRAERDDSVRAIVLTGAGDRAFSAGMHVDSFLGLRPADARRFIGQVRDFIGAVRTSPLPTAAMINGYCLGAAFELALACDLRISVDTAQFGLPEVKVGIPSVVDAALLQDHVGLSMAKEIILTGDLYGADDMYRLGMLNRVVGSDRLREETLALLSRLTRHTPTVLASQKRLFETWQNTALAVGIEASIEEFGRVFENPETQQQIRRYRAGLRTPR